MMGKLEMYYLFVSITILSSLHRCGTSNTGLKVSFETVICSMLQTISHTTTAHLSSFYLATVRGSVDRAPAASLNKRWNSILYLRLAIEGCDPEKGKRTVGARTYVAGR